MCSPVGGPAAGTPLVLLHGYVGDSGDWEPLLRELATELTVVAWDAPGFGGSSDPRDGLDLAGCADSLAELVAAAPAGRRPHGAPRGAGAVQCGGARLRPTGAGLSGDPTALARLLRQRQPCVVLTGAGASTESGIPDFRSAGGIWATYDPMEVASIEGFRRAPERVWEFYARRLAVLAEAEPNDAHQALASLEEQGLVEAVVTQNVDGLHQRAGSRNVLEVHGSIRGAVCPACGAREPFERVLELLPLPRCDCGEILKPGVVMFGELLPPGALERATGLARRARLLLVVGSSLEVYPVAGLPHETIAAGGSLAIVNRGATPFDGLAELVLDGSAGELLQAAVAALETGAV